jgi:hypothetical protein
MLQQGVITFPRIFITVLSSPVESKNCLPLFFYFSSSGWVVGWLVLTRLNIEDVLRTRHALFLRKKNQKYDLISIFSFLLRTYITEKIVFTILRYVILTTYTYSI